MKSKSGNRQRDYSKQTCDASETCGSDLFEVKQATGENADRAGLSAWTKAEFLVQAQVLARRLAGWHFDDGEPVGVPSEGDFLHQLERPFRDLVLRGKNEHQKTFVPPIGLTRIPEETVSDRNVVEQAASFLFDSYRKEETIWLLRDFYEHLDQLGNGDAENRLRLKVEELLDSPMFRRAYSEVSGDHIAGRQVDQSLLNELVEAANLEVETIQQPRVCITCCKPLVGRDHDRSQCHGCRSQEGKLLDLYVAIHAIGDSPNRIREWPMIRALLKDALGPVRKNKKLWELMTDRLRVKGWDTEQWLQTEFGDFINQLKSGLLKLPLSKDDIAENAHLNVVKPEKRKPYQWRRSLAEDEWIYENIHSKSFDEFRVEHSEHCQSNKHFGKTLARRSYWNRADRYADYHGLPLRRFKNACKCQDCQTVNDTR